MCDSRAFCAFLVAIIARRRQLQHRRQQQQRATLMNILGDNASAASSPPASCTSAVVVPVTDNDDVSSSNGGSFSPSTPSGRESLLTPRAVLFASRTSSVNGEDLSRDELDVRPPSATSSTRSGAEPLMPPTRPSTAPNHQPLLLTQAHSVDQESLPGSITD